MRIENVLFSEHCTHLVRISLGNKANVHVERRQLIRVLWKKLEVLNQRGHVQEKFHSSERLTRTDAPTWNKDEIFKGNNNLHASNITFKSCPLIFKLQKCKIRSLLSSLYGFVPWFLSFKIQNQIIAILLHGFVPWFLSFKIQNQIIAIFAAWICIDISYKKCLGIKFCVLS